MNKKETIALYDEVCEILDILYMGGVLSLEEQKEYSEEIEKIRYKIKPVGLFINPEEIEINYSRAFFELRSLWGNLVSGWGSNKNISGQLEKVINKYDGE